MDDRITRHGGVWALQVVEGVLWLATDRGLVGFHIECEGPAQEDAK